MLSILFVICFCLGSSMAMECRWMPDKYDKVAMMSRNILDDKSTRWPKDVVPFTFGSAFSRADRQLVYEAMKHIEERSCIRFVKRTQEVAYVVLINTKRGCFTSGLGYVPQRGPTELNLDPSGCMYKHTVVHELMHALGFMHEQNRPDRDQFVKIKWSNVKPDINTFYQFARAKGKNDQTQVCNFGKLEPYENCNNGLVANTFGMPYDYQSVMHYSRTAFTYTGGQTMYPVYQTGPLGNKKGLSQWDIKKLIAAYGCNNAPGPVQPSTIPPSPVPGSCEDSNRACPRLFRLCFRSPIVRKYCNRTCGVC